MTSEKPLAIFNKMRRDGDVFNCSCGGTHGLYSMASDRILISRRVEEIKFVELYYCDSEMALYRREL